MKLNIHPQFYTDCKATCSCGNSFITGSTKQNVSVEVCYKCHPLYTGEKKYIDTLGQVGKFQKKQDIAKTHLEKFASKKTKKVIKEDRRPKTLRELLTEI